MLAHDDVQPGAIPPPWSEYAKGEEIQRLRVIDDRLGRKYATVDELLAERRHLMRRCIRRMRRARGLK